jgi:hypothetical protein
MKTTMISIRVPETEKQRLLEIAAEEGKEHCSDVIRELIRARIDITEGQIDEIAAAAVNTSRVTSLLDQIRNLEERRDNFRRAVEENGGEPGLFFSGAPEHLRTALKLCEAHLNRLGQEMKQLLLDIENMAEYVDFQQCLHCLRLTQKAKACTNCGGALAKTHRIWRKLGNWANDFADEDFERAAENSDLT